MLTKIKEWFNNLPESAQSYFLYLLILNLSDLDVIPVQFKTNKQKEIFLKNYLDEVDLTTSEELKRFLLAYSVIDIIIQTRRDYDFKSNQNAAKKILKSLFNEASNSKFRPVIENHASENYEKIWHDAISSWNSLKASKELSLINLSERIIK